MSNIGDQISFTAHFATAAGTDTDPTTVKFFLREELDGTELEWTFNAAPVSGTHYPAGQNPIVKDSTGDFSVLFVARKAERITAMFTYTNTALLVLTQNLRTVLIRHAGINLVEP